MDPILKTRFQWRKDIIGVFLVLIHILYCKIILFSVRFLQSYWHLTAKEVISGLREGANDARELTLEVDL